MQDIGYQFSGAGSEISASALGSEISVSALGSEISVFRKGEKWIFRD